MKEPKIFCPRCGKRAYVIVWFTDEPGEGFGSANCPVCGGMDYVVRNGAVTDLRIVNPEEAEDRSCEMMSSGQFDREVMEYELAQGLI